MTPTGHKIYVITLVIIVLAVTIFLSILGASYYYTSLEERFYHEDHATLRPNGLVGHGLGIVGTTLILTGVFGYMARKRFRFLSRAGILKHWLEFHIFLCTLGPIMVLFHTAFKFGGIVSISFWSMVAVVTSGVLGRFIYLQIPRTIHGRELSLQEIQEVRENELAGLPQSIGTLSIQEFIHNSTILHGEYKGIAGIFKQYADEFNTKQKIKNWLRQQSLPAEEIKSIVRAVGQEMALNRKIKRLVTMQQYFRYWHIAHLPFAIIMLVIMVVHVLVAVAFGYTWIF